MSRRYATRLTMRLGVGGAGWRSMKRKPLGVVRPLTVGSVGAVHAAHGSGTIRAGHRRPDV
jgi:hypothetical protein